MRLILLFLLSYFQLSSQIDSLDYRIFNLDSRYDSFAYYVENQMGSPPDNVQYADYDSSILVIQYRPPIPHLRYSKLYPTLLESANDIYIYRTKLTSFDLNGNIRWMKYLNLNVFRYYLPVIHILDSVVYTMHIQRALIEGHNMRRKNYEDTVILSCYRILDGQLLHQDSLIGLFDYPIYFYDSTYTTSIQEMRGDTVYRVEKNYGIRSHQLLAKQSLILRIDKHNNHKITLREALNEGEINSVIDREERFEGMNCVYTKYRDSVTIVDHKFQKLIPNQILQDSILAHYWIVSADKIGDSLVFCLLKRKMDLSNKERIKRIYKAEVLKLRAYEKEKRGYNKLDLDTELKKYYAEKKNEAMKWKKYRNEGDSIFKKLSFTNGKLQNLGEFKMPTSFALYNLKSAIVFIRNYTNRKLGDASPNFQNISIYNKNAFDIIANYNDTIFNSSEYSNIHYNNNNILLLIHPARITISNIAELPSFFINDQNINCLKIFDGHRFANTVNNNISLKLYKKDLYLSTNANNQVNYISIIKKGDVSTKAILINGRIIRTSDIKSDAPFFYYNSNLNMESEIDNIKNVINNYFKLK